MSNPTGQPQHAQHPTMRNVFQQGANPHMNPAMHGGLGFPAGYNPQMQFHAPQPPQQQYPNMAMMGGGANAGMQARMQQLHQAHQAQQAQQAQAAQTQAQAQAHGQTPVQTQTLQQSMAQNPGINVNGAGLSNVPAALLSRATNPGMLPMNTGPSEQNRIPEKHKQQLLTLLQQITQGGVHNSVQFTSTIAPHLPAILALAKTGQLTETQMGQLKILVRMVTDSKNRIAGQVSQQANQVQRPPQGSPQVTATASSFPNSPAMMGTPPQQQQQHHQPNLHLANQQNHNQNLPQNALLQAQSSSPHIQGQNRAQAQNQMLNQQPTQPPHNHLPTPQQLHFQSQSHLQPPGSSATPPPPVAGIKRKAPPGMLSMPPNDLAQPQGQGQTQGQANGIGGMQMNGGGIPHQANGLGQQVNGLGQPANAMQANGMGQQPQQGPQLATNGQNGQPRPGVPANQLPPAAQLPALPKHITAGLLQRAKVIAAQQNRSDEQYIMHVARMLFQRYQASQAQTQAQAQATQPPAVTQAGGLPGTTQQPGATQGQSQPQKPPQASPQNPAQVQQPPQLPPSLLQPPQQQPTLQPPLQNQPPQTQQPTTQSQPQLSQQTPQTPQMTPSTSAQGQQPVQASTSATVADSPTSSTPQPARPTLGPSMAQINVTQSGGASPVTTPTTLNPPNVVSPSALNVTNPGPQVWPTSKNLKIFGSFRSGARPTLSQGLAGGPILGTPSQLLRFGAGDEALGLGIGEAENEEKEDGASVGGSVAAKKTGSGASGEPVGVVSGRRTVQDLVAELDPKVSIDTEMESYLLARADEFIDSVMHFACRIAKHRGSDQVEPRDIQLHLERNHNIRIPGFASDEIRGALNRPSVEVKPKNIGGTDKSKKKKLNPEAAASLRVARVTAVQNARGAGRD